MLSYCMVKASTLFTQQIHTENWYWFELAAERTWWQNLDQFVAIRISLIYVLWNFNYFLKILFLYMYCCSKHTIRAGENSDKTSVHPLMRFVLCTECVTGSSASWLRCTVGDRREQECMCGHLVLKYISRKCAYEDLQHEDGWKDRGH